MYFLCIRFNKKRIEEELEILRRKILRLRAQTEGPSVLEKLRQELKEYKEILKCNICVERPKEVFVIVNLIISLLAFISQ